MVCAFLGDSVGVHLASSHESSDTICGISLLDLMRYHLTLPSYFTFLFCAQNICLSSALVIPRVPTSAFKDLDSVLKSRGITLLTKVHIVKAMVFPVVMYRCERWTIKKTKHQRIDAFELWCWRRLLRVPWIARRTNQSIQKEINPEYSLKDWYWSCSSNTLATWCKQPTHWKRPWQKLKAKE